MYLSNNTFLAVLLTQYCLHNQIYLTVFIISLRKKHSSEKKKLKEMFIESHPCILSKLS